MNSIIAFFNYLYILILLFDVWLHWVFIAACGLSVIVSGANLVAMCGLLIEVAPLAAEHGL